MSSPFARPEPRYPVGPRLVTPQAAFGQQLSFPRGYGGCWLWQGPARGWQAMGPTWLADPPAAGAGVALRTYFHLTLRGPLPADVLSLFPGCGQAACCNPWHAVLPGSEPDDDIAVRPPLKRQRRWAPVPFTPTLAREMVLEALSAWAEARRREEQAGWRARIEAFRQRVFLVRLFGYSLYNLNIVCPLPPRPDLDPALHRPKRRERQQAQEGAAD